MNNVDEYFSVDNQKLIIVAIREVLKEDDSIGMLDQIGFEDEGYTKQDILCSQIFPFVAFIVNVY